MASNRPPSPPGTGQKDRGAGLPVLSGLDADDDEDEGRAQPRPLQRSQLPPRSQPEPPRPLSGPSLAAESDRPEPSVTIAEDFLAAVGVLPQGPSFGPSQPAPRSFPPRPPSPSRPGPGEDLPPDKTNLINLAQVERVVPHSGRHALVRGPTSSGTHRTVDPGAIHAGPDMETLSEEPPAIQQEATMIVSGLKLVELEEAKARHHRDKARPSTQRLKVAGPSGQKALAAAQSGAGKEGKDGSGKKKNPVKDVKERSRAKVAPIDPQRLATQQEAAEQKAQERSAVFTLSGSLAADDDKQEGTMIGRFLGMVGLGLDKPAAPPPPPRDPQKDNLEAVQAAPLLGGINPGFLRDAIQSGDLRLIAHGRDMLLEPQGRALLVVEGQLALARFRPDVLEKERRAQRAYLDRAGDKKAEKREQNRRQEAGPIIRLCESNLAVFMEGDLIGLDLTAAGGPIGVYSVTPVKVLSIANARLETWRRTYQFFGDRLRRAADAARGRIDAASGARGLVADFYVRHGMSIAMTLRVREVDKCIECYECEKACEARYGVKRLSLKGKILGGLDFVDCCRTCLDQRCIDVCAYDAIKFDGDRKEVTILEDACTGCSMCSIACPYDAIEMHELDERPLLRLRLEKQNKLGFGEGTPRRAQLRRIASKCDHCVSYEDQACISACPTNALLEIDPESLFVERTEAMTESALSGFAEDAPVDPNALFGTAKFFQGVRASEEGESRSEPPPRGFTFLWIAGLLGFLLCFAEIILRRYLPERSVLFYQQTHSLGMDADLALQNIEFRPGGEFAVWLGYVGSAILFSSMFYSLHKWVPGIKRLGSFRWWFSYHLWAGTIGPGLILLHSAAKLDNWVSLAVWAMMVTVLSGLIGRYLTTELPDLAAQASLYALDLERGLAELRNRHAGVYVADRFAETLRRRYARVNAPGISGALAGFLAIGILFRDEVERPLRRLLLRRRLVGIKDRYARGLVAKMTTKLVLLERRRMLLPRLQPIFREWKTVHVPFAIAMSVLSGIHIFIELTR